MISLRTMLNCSLILDRDLAETRMGIQFMLGKLKLEAREALCRTGNFGRLSVMFCHDMKYNFTPAQLHLLCDSLDQTRHLKGPILEIGCASGQTTIYLNTHLKTTGALKPYVCIDTFDGFTQKDVDFEVRFRGKKRRVIERRGNLLEQGTFRVNDGLQRIRPCQGYSSVTR